MCNYSCTNLKHNNNTSPPTHAHPQRQTHPHPPTRNTPCSKIVWIHNTNPPTPTHILKMHYALKLCQLTSFNANWKELIKFQHVIQGVWKSSHTILIVESQAATNSKIFQKKIPRNTPKIPKNWHKVQNFWEAHIIWINVRHSTQISTYRNDMKDTKVFKRYLS